MSFSEVKRLIDQHPDLADFEGGVSADDIRYCEAKLGVKLPVSYVEFLRTYGVGNFGSQEIFGLGIPETGAPNVVWYTEATRRDEPAFPKQYVAVYDAGLGEILCLATDRMGVDGECPVVAWRPGASKQESEVVAGTFADFLWDLINREVERLK